MHGQGEEWWYVDVGYLTEQITRYPEPIINNYDNTYFRICKGNIHSIRFQYQHQTGGIF